MIKDKKMSCIQKLLELKGQQEFMKINSRVVIEIGGKYKEHDYCVVFNESGFRCGYVAITKDSKYFNEDHDFSDIEDQFEVHGGVTHFGKAWKMVNDDVMKMDCGDMWIGFDAAHAGDAEDFSLIKKYFNREKSDFGLGCFLDQIRSKNYMESECKKLIDQIVEGESYE